MTFHFIQFIPIHENTNVAVYTAHNAEHVNEVHFVYSMAN